MNIRGKPFGVILHCPVPKQSVLAGDLHYIDDITRNAREWIQQHGRIQLWNLAISGYDDDPRPLWEIPEVRTWCKNVHTKVPYLPCLLSENSIIWYVLCILEPKTLWTERVGRLKSPEDGDRFLAEVTVYMSQFFVQCGVNTEEAFYLAAEAGKRIGCGIGRLLPYRK